MKIQEKIAALSSRQKKWGIATIGVLIILLALALNSTPKAQQQSAILTEESVALRVTQLVKLPNAGERPIVSTIVGDVKTMQPFFQNAQQGDITLLYTESQYAVIYSPSKDMIINQGPIDTPKKPEVKEAATTTKQAATSSQE